MHMADALVSATVGGAFWAGAGGLMAYSARRVRQDLDERKVPLMGVVAAFVFAAQMVNFSIPGTGSSGHLGGGLLMAVLLGPHAAFLSMFSVLAVQALFFADGGLLALGCNVVNLGFWPCFVAAPLLFRPLAGQHPTRARLVASSIVAALVGVQLGSFGVVVQTSLSGVTELPLGAFFLLMQPIHLAIGVVEGLATAGVLLFLAAARPEVMAAGSPLSAGASVRRVLVGLLVATSVIGGGLSWFASTHPDGLEWAILGTSGQHELRGPGSGLHEVFAAVQDRTTVLPDYGFSVHDGEESAPNGSWPVVDAGTSVSGLVGSTLTLLAMLLFGAALRRSSRRPPEGG